MPSTHLRTPALFLSTLLLAALAACSSSSAGTGGAGGAGGGGDGKVHPAGNGTPESETVACHALTSAVSSLSLSRGCVSTVPTCPDFLRAEFSTSCLEYDEGSVEGCVAYYGMAKTCDALATAVADCAVMPIAGSAPKGCP
jgi:hypothetical protein